MEASCSNCLGAADCIYLASRSCIGEPVAAGCCRVCYLVVSLLCCCVDCRACVVCNLCVRVKFILILNLFIIMFFLVPTQLDQFRI